MHRFSSTCSTGALYSLNEWHRDCKNMVSRQSLGQLRLGIDRSDFLHPVPSGLSVIMAELSHILGGPEPDRIYEQTGACSGIRTRGTYV